MQLLEQLKKHLIMLLTLSTSCIMSIVILLLFFIYCSTENNYRNDIFNVNLNSLIEKLRYSCMISQTNIISMENRNNLIIYLENDGHTLFNNQLLGHTKDDIELINQVKKRALSEGFNLSENPIDSNVSLSSKYNIKYKGKYYSGIAAIVPGYPSNSSLIMIHYDSDSRITSFGKILIFIIIDIIGCYFLFVMITTYISKALKPVKENHEKQVQFIAAASHELRSPLAVIKAGISSIKDDLSLAPKYIPNIENECSIMTRLISDMLLLANSDAKNWTLNNNIIDMDTLLIEMYDLYCPLIKNHNIDFNLNLPDEPLHNINGDAERIKQIITVLLDNAIEYTQNNGSITINSYNNKENVIIEVQDNGIGINDTQKQFIFDRFYRGDKSRNSRNHFGLGLNIALELVKLHKGHIKIKDTLGGGATFIIEFPSLNENKEKVDSFV